MCIRDSDKAPVAEDVAQDVAVVSLRDVVHYDVLHASLACRTGDDFSHALSIAAVSYTHLQRFRSGTKPSSTTSQWASL